MNVQLVNSLALCGWTKHQKAMLIYLMKLGAEKMRIWSDPSKRKQVEKLLLQLETLTTEA